MNSEATNPIKREFTMTRKFTTLCKCTLRWYEKEWIEENSNKTADQIEKQIIDKLKCVLYVMYV